MQYQIHLAVNVEAESQDEAEETGARLEWFLAQHCDTTSQGIVTEIHELDLADIVE